MPRTTKKKRKAPVRLVPVACTADSQLAKQYRKLLKKSRIPATITSKPPEPGFFGFVIQVPEKFVAEAGNLIESGGDEHFFDSMFDPPNPHRRTG